MLQLRRVRLLGRDVYPGWPIAAALGVTETVSWGIVYYAFAVLLGPMEAELGWSRAQLTLGFSLALVTSGLAAVPVGAWIDRRGARGPMTAGSVLASALVLAWSAVGSLPAYYALWLAMGVAWAMVLYDPAFAAVTQWFGRGRARALTVVTGCAAFASTLFFPLTTWLVGAHGWRGALATLGVLLVLVTVPLHALLLRGRPEDEGVALDGPAMGLGASAPADLGARAALRGGAFWWLALAFGLTAVVTVGLSVHLVPYLLDVGHGPAFAAAAAGLVGAMKFPARVLFARLAERFSAHQLAAVLVGTTAAAVALVGAAPTVAGALAFAVLYGAADGATTTARPALLAALYGRASYGTIAGAMTATGVAARAAAPVGIGLLYDALGTYRPVMLGLAGLAGVAVLSLLAAARPVRPVVEAR